MKKTPKKKLGYFCCCDNEDCGNLSWIDEEVSRYNATSVEYQEIINELLSNGEMLYPKKYNLISQDTFLCSQCEKSLTPISFKDVSVEMRKKIFMMDEEERLSWVHNYLMVQRLKDDETEK